MKKKMKRALKDWKSAPTINKVVFVSVTLSIVGTSFVSYI